LNHILNSISVYDDKNASGLGTPIMIGLAGIRVKSLITRITEDKYEGKYGEKFPQDVTATFSWPSEDSNIGYYVYLFKGDEYCFRSWKSKSGKDCDEWKKNKLLFCPKDKTTTEPTGSREIRLKADIMSLNSLTLFLTIISFKIFALKN
jgi:hypothetical protein